MKTIMEDFGIHFRSWWPTATMAVLGPAMIPFSRLWRHRLSQCRRSWNNPFLAREVEISELLRPSLEVRLASVTAGEHNVSAFELLSIASLVAQFQSRRVFEIGTFDGRTTRVLAMNAASDARVYTLNIPAEERLGALGLDPVDAQLASKVKIGERFIGTPEAARIEQLWGDSATFDYSPYADQIDFVFIDGAHSYRYVKNDTERAVHMIGGGQGLIVWHDATLAGVVDYLTELGKSVPLRVIRGTTLAVVTRVNNQFVDVVKCRPQCGSADARAA